MLYNCLEDTDGLGNCVGLLAGNFCLGFKYNIRKYQFSVVLCLLFQGRPTAALLER